jgi:hypothetical protein
MGYGVIGSPADSGSVSLGSNPGTPAGRVPSQQDAGWLRRKSVPPLRRGNPAHFFPVAQPGECLTRRSSPPLGKDSDGPERGASRRSTLAAAHGCGSAFVRWMIRVGTGWRLHALVPQLGTRARLRCVYLRVRIPPGVRNASGSGDRPSLADVRGSRLRPCKANYPDRHRASAQECQWASLSLTRAEWPSFLAFPAPVGALPRSKCWRILLSPPSQGRHLAGALDPGSFKGRTHRFGR